MAQVRSIIGALFVVTLILVAPSVISEEISNQISISTLAGKVVECNKKCEGKGTPADIELCKEKCTLLGYFGIATMESGICFKNCEKVKNNQSSFKLCDEKCREKYNARLSEIAKGQNM
jgi:hypothetical protein